MIRLIQVIAKKSLDWEKNKMAQGTYVRVRENPQLNSKDITIKLGTQR